MTRRRIVCAVIVGIVLVLVWPPEYFRVRRIRRELERERERHVAEWDAITRGEEN